MSEADAGSSRCFIDTNIWLYAFIEDETSGKSLLAKSLIQDRPGICLSTQVINEACVNLLKKALFSEQQISWLVDSWYTKYTIVELGRPVLLQASDLRQKYKFSFWDSLIISSALQVGAAVVYSEDMQDGLVIENRLTIVNPLKVK